MRAGDTPAKLSLDQPICSDSSSSRLTPNRSGDQFAYCVFQRKDGRFGQLLRTVTAAVPEVASPTTMTSQPIENYGVIGNMKSVALVCVNGSIDFLCYPDFDSPT